MNDIWSYTFYRIVENLKEILCIKFENKFF